MSEFLYFIAGCIFSFGLYYVQNNRKKKIREKIRDLDFHLQYVQKLRKSSVELNRKAFMWLFAVLFCISTSLLIPILFKTYPFSGLPFAEAFSNTIVTFMLIGASAFSVFEFIIYHDVSNFNRAMERIEAKKRRLNEKLENS